MGHTRHDPTPTLGFLTWAIRVLCAVLTGNHLRVVDQPLTVTDCRLTVADSQLTVADSHLTSR